MKILFLSLCTLCFITVANAQQNEGLILQIGITEHNVSTPFANLLELPFNTGFELGIQRKYPAKRHLYQSIDLGFYDHKSLEKGAYLSSDFIYRPQFEWGGLLETNVGLGYLHTFSNYQLYELNENREYTPKTDLGKPSVFLDFGFGLGYQISNKQHFMLRYSWGLQIPHSVLLPLFPVSFLQLSYRHTLQ